MYEYYVLVGVVKGTTKYYAEDYSAGGYPYWSDYSTSAKKFRTIQPIMEKDSFLAQAKRIEWHGVRSEFVANFEDAKIVAKQQEIKELEAKLAKARDELNELHE